MSGLPGYGRGDSCLCDGYWRIAIRPYCRPATSAGENEVIRMAGNCSAGRVHVRSGLLWRPIDADAAAAAGCRVGTPQKASAGGGTVPSYTPRSSSSAFTSAPATQVPNDPDLPPGPDDRLDGSR